MTKRQLQSSLGIFLVVAHFMVILLVIILWALRKGFDTRYLIESLPIMAPMFAVYTTAILAHLLRDDPVGRADLIRISFARSFVSFFIPCIFVLALLLIIEGWVNRRMEFSEFKAALGICETIFGVYVGSIIHSLFRTESESGLPVQPAGQ